MIKILIQLQTMLDVLESCEIDPSCYYYIKNLDEDEQYLMFEDLEHRLSKIEFPSSDEISDCVSEIISDRRNKNEM